MHLRRKHIGPNEESENVVVLSSTDEDLFVDYINALDTSQAANQQINTSAPTCRDTEKRKTKFDSTITENDFTFEYIYNQASLHVEKQMKK